LNGYRRNLKKIKMPATRLLTGESQPSNKDEESWLGKVFMFLPTETIPKDVRGELMLPLAQIHLPSLPYIPPILKETELITVFMSSEFPEPDEEMGANWLIREYKTLNDLVKKDIKNPESYLNPLPLKPIFLEKDYPLWDSADWDWDLQEEVVKLEREGKVDYHDVAEHSFDHKVGGYPSFAQSGTHPGEGFEFAFQISSDNNVCLNVVDSGSFLFYKHSTSGKWHLYYDYY
jgi:uncharacterized protein YwqG